MSKNLTRRFFSRITGYFKSRFEGRYFSVILTELARIEPKAFLEILKAANLTLPNQHAKDLLSGGLDIALEWRFPHKRRIADFALCVKDNPVLLAEIKVEDDLHKGQLDDYLSIVCQGVEHPSTGIQRPCFLLLSRYPPKDASDSAAIETAAKAGMPVAQLRAGHLHKILEDHGGTVTRMLCEYLEDVGMTYQAIDLKQDQSALIHMCYKMIGMPSGGQGRVRTSSSIETIPNLMARLFGNVEVLSTWLYSERRNSFGNRFRRDFYIDRDEVNVEGEASGGSVSFCGIGRFNCPKKSWAYLSIGYLIWMEPKPSCGLFAEFEWNGGEKVNWEKRAAYRTFAKFPDEPKAIEILRDILNEARTNAIATAPPPYRQIFRRFKEL
jgi:hypothetical protein